MIDRDSYHYKYNVLQLKSAIVRVRDILRVSYSDIMCIVLCVSRWWYWGRNVRPAIQIVTITLLIPCCIPSTTYTITIYIVKISNKNNKNIRNNWKSSEINKNIFILL